MFAACALAAWALVWTRVGCFNVDTNHAVVIPSPASPEALFGYSVALTRDPTQLLVGEPYGNWTHRPDVARPGTVYRCRLEAFEAPGGPRCVEVTLDPRARGTDNETIGDMEVHHLKNDSMFASTVVASSDGLTLVCGPGWKNHRFLDTHYIMNGLCFAFNWTHVSGPTVAPSYYAPLADEERQIRKVDEKDKTKNKIDYYLGQAGFSAHVSEETREVLLGAPGVFRWRGTVVRLRYRPDGGRWGHHHGCRLDERRVPFVDWMQEVGYFGYSVTGGRFVVDGETRIQYAAGAPRAADNGKVLLFELPRNNMTVLQELVGDQLGEYFGAAVLATDVNADGLADLLVGAPLYSSARAGDEGRVYVFLSDGRVGGVDGPLRPAQPPLGPLGPPAVNGTGSEGADDEHGLQGARFGSSIASAGDVNGDGYNDVWVGAPYEDGGRGAVYLFLGSPSGIQARPSQRIAARNISGRGHELRAFGFSLAAAVDVDGNGLRDVAVGAPFSGHAVLLLTRPVASLQASLSAPTDVLPVDTTSFELTACLLYQGTHAQPKADAEVAITLEGPAATLASISPPSGFHQPALLSRQILFNMTLRLDRKRCERVTVLMRPQPGAANHSAHLDAVMRFKLLDGASSRGQPFCKGCPVLDPAVNTTASLRVQFSGCPVHARTCRPRLQLDARWFTQLPLVVGSVREVTLQVNVRNSGDPAFLTRVEVALPAPLDVARVPAPCYTPAARDAHGGVEHLMHCNLGASHGRGHELSFELALDVSRLELAQLASSSSLTVQLSAAADSGGPRGERDDTASTLELPLTAHVGLGLDGRASPETCALPEAGKAVSFNHTYQVRDEGPTLIGRATLRLLVPSRVQVDGAGGRLVTMLEAHALFEAGHQLIRCARVVAGAARNTTVPVNITGVHCGLRGVTCEQLYCPLTLLPRTPIAVDLRLRLLVSGLEAFEALGSVAGALAVVTEAEVVLQEGGPPIPEDSRVRLPVVRLTTLFTRPPPPASVQLWVVAPSVAVGLLLLAVLILALRKAGFFMRKEIPAVEDNALLDKEEFADGIPGLFDDPN